MHLLNRKDLQACRDVYRAEVLLARLRGFTREDAADALNNHASMLGVSLHAAALGVLATTPSEPVSGAQRLAPVPAPTATSPVLDTFADSRQH